MLELLRQRLQSKTYLTALIGAILTIVDQQSGAISGLFPVEYRSYLVMAWPLIMLTLREVTTTALADK